jgi:hypothetical protein
MAAPDVSVEKLQEREDEQEANPFATKDDLSNFATKDDLDAAVSQIVEAIEDVGGASVQNEPRQTSTTLPIILPGNYKPSK